MSASVLLIEDYSAHRALLQTVVSRMGCQAIEAADGRSGLALATERQPAMVVLDLLLPDFDGLEVLRRLKADQRTASIPVLIVTAIDDQERVVEALEAGAEDYVTKPFCNQTLQARMRAILRTARLQQDLSLRVRQAEMAARISRAAASGDLESVCGELVGSLGHETGAREARLYLIRDDRIIGPMGDPDLEVGEHSIVRVLQQQTLGKLLCGETPWQRVRASELSGLGHRMAASQLIALPLRAAEKSIGLVLLASDGETVRESGLRRIADLSSSAALALSAAMERAGREESDKRYRLLFEQAGDGVAVLDPANGACREVNHTLASWLTAMPIALVSRPFVSLFAPQVAGTVSEAIRSAAHGQRLQVNDLLLADGGVAGRAVSVEFRRIKHAAGNDVVAVLRDLQSEHAVQEYAQKTADLIRLSRTVRALNHEINNPLTCIIGLTQLLQIRLTDLPEHLPQLNRILESAEQITTFTRQLREVAVQLGGDEPLSAIEELLKDLPAASKGA